VLCVRRSKLEALFCSQQQSSAQETDVTQPSIRPWSAASSWAHSLFCMILMPQGLQTHMRVRPRVCHMRRPGRWGKSALWFTTLRPHWLTTCSQAAATRAAKKSDIWWNTSHETTRRIKTALLESRFSPHHFHLSALWGGAAALRMPTCSLCAATTLFPICEHAHAARFCTHLAQGLCENKTLIYKANFSPSAPALWEVA